MKVKVGKWNVKLGWLYIPKELRTVGDVKIKINNDIFDGRIDDKGRLFSRKAFLGRLVEGMEVDVDKNNDIYVITIPKPESDEVSEIKSEENNVEVKAEAPIQEVKDEMKEDKSIESTEAKSEEVENEVPLQEVKSEKVEEKLEEKVEQKNYAYLKMNAQEFINFLRLVKEIHEEPVFQLNEKGLYINQLDSSHVMAIEAFLPWENFDNYDFHGFFDFSVNVKDIVKTFQPKKHDDVEVFIEDEKVRIKCGGIEKSFPTVKFSEKEEFYPMSKLNYKSYFIIEANEVWRILKAFENVHTIKIKIDDGKVSFLTPDGTANLDVIEAYGNVESNYNTSYLLEIFRGLRNMKTVVRIEFDCDKPLKIIDKNKDITVWLAPYVE